MMWGRLILFRLINFVRVLKFREFSYCSWRLG